MKFDELAKLEPNWDSYGGSRIDPRVLEKAHALHRILPGQWSVVPCSDGSIQLERHAEGLDMELMISVAVQL